MLTSTNRDRYQQLLHAMIDPQTTAFIPEKHIGSFARIVLKFLGFRK
jgi:hypothetical protein